MICRKLEALFVHIPKAAGQSVERVLLAEMGVDCESRAGTLLAPNPDPSRGPPRLAHLTAEEYVKLGWLSEEDFGALFKFAFVRNPWARLASEYRYRNLGPSLGFREFVLSRFRVQKMTTTTTARITTGTCCASRVCSTVPTDGASSTSSVASNPSTATSRRLPASAVCATRGSHTPMPPGGTPAIRASRACWDGCWVTYQGRVSTTPSTMWKRGALLSGYTPKISRDFVTVLENKSSR